MSRVIEFGVTAKAEIRDAELTGIDKMQLAVQIAALVRASFKQPTDSDVRDILQMASSQLSAPFDLPG